MSCVSKRAHEALLNLAVQRRDMDAQEAVQEFITEIGETGVTNLSA